MHGPNTIERSQVAAASTPSPAFTSLTGRSTLTPLQAMPSAFSWPVAVPSALRAPAPLNSGVRPSIGHNMHMALLVLSLVFVAWGLGAEFILISGGASVNDIKTLKQGVARSRGERVVFHLLKHRVLAAWLDDLMLLALILVK